MGFVKFFSKSAAPTLPGLPSGSFTVDRTGEIVAGTVPSHFPATAIRDIGRQVLDTFREAHGASLPLAELTIHFGGFKIAARELRGGALIFVAPKNPLSPT